LNEKTVGRKSFDIFTFIGNNRRETIGRIIITVVRNPDNVENKKKSHTNLHLLICNKKASLPQASFTK
jgi:hypothetical protein